MGSYSSDEEFKKRLLKTFKREAEEQIKSIIEGLIEIEKMGFSSNYTHIIDRIFRNAHSLKGSSRTVNMLAIEEICQEMEGLFHKIKKGDLSFNSNMIETLLESCSILESVINNPEMQIPSKKIAESIKKLIDDKTYTNKPLEESNLPNTEKTQNTKLSQDSKLQKSSEAILKIDSNKFEALLNETEEIISLKGYLNNNLMTLNDLDDRIVRLLRYSTKLLSQTNKPDSLLNTLQSLNEDFKGLSVQFKQHKKFFKEGKFFLERKVDDILFELREIVMMPIASLLESFPIMIRDIAKSQNKEVEFIIEGKELHLDRRILDELRDPLTHIFRNAIDHGIETSQERLSVNKNPKAMIKFIANIEQGGEVVLKIMDDGKGIDIDALKERLLSKNLLTNNEISSLNQEEIISFIFKPEISTAKIVTNISGRGLGMTIVREKIESLGGTINVITERGKGSVFIIRLPVNISTIKIITFKAFNGDIYGIPTRNVAYSSRVKLSELKTVEGIDTVNIKGSLVSMIKIDDVLDITVGKNEKYDYINYIVINSDNKSLAFSIKELLTEEEVFLKPFQGQIRRIKNFIGAATISSGKTILILNSTDIVKSALKRGFVPTFRPEDVSVSVKKKSILIAEDSITARTLFKGILEGAGYDVKTAVDGLEALNLLKTRDYDLLLSDIQMPGLNGFELTEKIRNDRKLFRLPVVLITGLESQQDKERGIEVGANAYIVKSSFDQSNLLEVIRRLI